MPVLPLLIIVGTILGGSLGAAILALSIGHRVTAAGIAVGALSTAVLGGWFAFVIGCSSAIFRQGWKHAVAGSADDREVSPSSSIDCD